MKLEPTKAYHITVEGRIEEISPNDGQATTIAQLNHALWGGDYICGNVVVCPSSMLT